jgi:hypothetical protein
MGCRTQATRLATRAVARQATRQVAWRSCRRASFRERGAGLRVFGFADISTSQQGRCRSWMRLRHLRVFFAARPSARPSPPRWLRSALPGEPRRQRLAPLGPARSRKMPMPSRREGCQQTGRARGRARSARVVAVHRKEADLDRFVAALLALATDPSCPAFGAPSQGDWKVTGNGANMSAMKRAAIYLRGIDGRAGDQGPRARGLLDPSPAGGLPGKGSGA